MRLVGLRIAKSTDGTVIRDIRLKRTGLSLVIDRDSKQGESGNNLGKTTFVKLIDVALGASSPKIVYKNEEGAESGTLKKFINGNKVYAELKVEKRNGETVLLRRDLFEKGKCYIDGKSCKSRDEYNIELKKLVFPGDEESVTFRELIPLFVRHGKKLNTVFRYLDNYSSEDKYILCYRALLSLQKKDDVGLRQTVKEKTDENKAILKKAGVADLSGLERKISESVKMLHDLSSKMKSDEVVVGFSGEKRNADLAKRVDELSSEVSETELEIGIFESKIENERLSVSPVDMEALEILYGEVSSLLPLKADFDGLVRFHEKMVNSRIDRYKAKIAVLKEKLEEKKKELRAAKKEYADGFVDYKYGLNEATNPSFEEVVDLRSAINMLNAQKARYVGNMDVIEKAKQSLSQIAVQTNDDGRKKEIVREFFAKASERLLGTGNNIEFTDSGFPVRLEAEDNGDGNLKILIACFAYALNALYETLNLDRPAFLVEDALENASLKYLRELIDFSKEHEMQLVIPILYDRVQSLGVSDEDVVLYLSKGDRLFRI